MRSAGGSDVSDTDLSSRYHTHCDPRLNAEQALELGFFISGRLSRRRKAVAQQAKDSQQAKINKTKGSAAGL